jgi:predicted ribonuclease toxin of YeeF-YezG toxin-antitoxin module
MRNTTTILFTTILLFSITIETVKAESSSTVQKEQKSSLTKNIFTLADKILKFPGNILTQVNEENSNKFENVSTKEQVVPNKQKNDIVNNLYSFGEDIVKFSWNIVTLGYDEKDSSNYQEEPTYRQWENVEAMSIFMFIGECFANSSVGDGH